MEHPLSAYYHEIAHGAGLIMLSRAYYTHFVEHCPELHDRFIDMAKAMGKTDAKEPMDFVTALVDLQKACGVDELKMSDYGHYAGGVPQICGQRPEHHGHPVQAGPSEAHR